MDGNVVAFAVIFSLSALILLGTLFSIGMIIYRQKSKGIGNVVANVALYLVAILLISMLFSAITQLLIHIMGDNIITSIIIIISILAPVIFICGYCVWLLKDKKTPSPLEYLMRLASRKKASSSAAADKGKGKGRAKKK